MQPPHESSAHPHKQRDRFVRAAAELFRLRGYNGTGTADIVALARGPKGSLYHYFPGGKEEIAKAALAYAAQVASNSLRSIETASAAERLLGYGHKLAGWMDASACREGCPIATTLLELAPESEAVAALGAEAFRDWADIFARDLEKEGVDSRRAGDLGRLAIASMEGALLMARADINADIIRKVSAEIADLFRSAVASAASQRKETTP